MTRTQLFDVVKANIRSVVPRTRSLPIPETTSIRELGGNSLEVANILTLSMAQLGIEVPVDRCMKQPNLAALLDLFEEALRSR